MCGVLGEFAFNQKLISKNRFLDILSMSKNRGPDNDGYLKYKNQLQFGFNRLSILDLSIIANQPTESKDRRYIMVYNGEIYNYQSIRNDLIRHGVIFQGNGDTEVLIESFSTFGIKETIAIIDGMYAIGIFDKKLKILYLIRDHAGIKPLHYAYNDKVIFFASQSNQISVHPTFKGNDLDLEVLNLFIDQHYLPAPFGLFKDTFQVMPGEIVSFSSDSHVKKNRYWELNKLFKPEISEREDALRTISKEIIKSVSKQLISDVPIGAFLSGGIDSSLICSSINNRSKNDMITFTLGSDSEIYDESDEAKQFADLIGIRNNIYLMNRSNVLDIFDGMIKSITEPIADISMLPTYALCKFASEDVSVCLSGDGGDELFFGYERFWSLIKNIKIQNQNYLFKYLIYGFDKVLTNNANINSLCLFNQQSLAHYHLHNRFNNTLKNDIAPELINVSLPKAYDVYNYPNTKNESELLNFMRHAEFYGMMQKTLKKMDIASMSNSLEVRVPFLSKKFIENSIKINPFLSYGPNHGKVSSRKNLLIQLLNNNFPEKVFDKRKRGFSVPLQEWIKTDLFEPISDVVLDEKNIEYFGFDKLAIKKMIDDHHKGVDHKWPIFTIFTLFSWKNNLSV